MGAMQFMTWAKGRNARRAFRNAVENARWSFGNSGRTGTIAEKERFFFVEVPAQSDPELYARKLLSDDDPRFLDIRGPAGCVKLKQPGMFLFFGWAPA